MINFFKSIVGAIGMGAVWVIMFGMLPGWVYWLWMAIHLGSFWMFLLAFLGPLGMVAAVLGLWSLIFRFGFSNAPIKACESDPASDRIVGSTDHHFDLSYPTIAVRVLHLRPADHLRVLSCFSLLYLRDSATFRRVVYSPFSNGHFV